MRWPWQRKPEDRASYTDSIVNAVLAAVSGNTASAGSTAALEAAAGAVARAFAAATVEGASPAIMGALTPDVLSLIGRNLIRAGDSVHMIETGPDGLKLCPVGTWVIQGDADPATWWIRADLFGPTGNSVRVVPHSAVVHVRYAVDPCRPWQGVSPLAWAETAATLLAGAETALTRDMSAAGAYLIPQPPTRAAGDDDDSDPLAGLKSALLSAKGKSVFVETSQSSYGGDHRDRPREDWEQKRLGPNPPESLVSLHGAAAEAVLSAVGLDPVLAGFRGGDGTMAREAYRRFERLVVQPLGRIVEAELRLKLDSPGLMLKFDSLRASDFAGAARAYKAMVEAGVSPEAAAAILDLDVT